MKTALALTLMLASPLALAQTSVSIQGLVELVIYLLIVGGILWLLFWLVNYLQPPEPIGKVLRVIIMVVSVLILINILLGFIGKPVLHLR